MLTRGTIVPVRCHLFLPSHSIIARGVTFPRCTLFIR